MRPITKLKPPVARKDPHALPLHGHVLQDDYAWLREKDSPETLEYLAAENAYTATVMEPLQPLIDTLYAEMLSHIQQTDVSVPYRDGRFDYYARTVEGKQYPIYCRVPAETGSALRPLPSGGLCGRGSSVGCESAGGGSGIHVHRGLGCQRRWKPAGVHDRQYRFSPVHAACEESSDWRNAAFAGGAGWFGHVGCRRSHAVL